MCCGGAHLVEWDDWNEVAIAVAQVAGRLRAHGKLRFGAHPRKEPRFQQPVAVCLDILQGSRSTAALHGSALRDRENASLSLLGCHHCQRPPGDRERTQNVAAKTPGSANTS